MINREEYIILYDYYSELLKEDEKKYFEDYYFDNLSLSEIAENNNISRNAVHKHIKAVEEKLGFYEEKLKLLKKDKILKDIIDSIKDEDISKKLNNFINME